MLGDFFGFKLADAFAGDPIAKWNEKSVQIERADARIRTVDPFITSVDQVSPTVAAGPGESREERNLAPLRWRPKTGYGEGVDPT